jgi:hypothetical protein
VGVGGSVEWRCRPGRSVPAGGSQPVPGQQPRPDLVHQRAAVDARARLGFGRIAASDIEGTEYVRKSGMKWMSGGTKRRCDRALCAPGSRQGGRAPAQGARQGALRNLAPKPR